MIKRRDLLASAGAMAALPAMAQAPQASPNILWFISDDASPYIRAYGDRLANTPTVDGLAQRSILYRNAFSVSPVCAPSRFGLATGIAPESAGPAHHMRAEARLPAMIRALPEYLRRKDYFCFNNAKTDYNTRDIQPARVWDESSPFANWRKRPAGKPFFGVITSMTTHESALEGAVGGKVKPEHVTVPAYLPDTPEVRQDIASYYNAMERMDRDLAAVLADLEADGMAQDTIVFYFSDNGGCWPRSKRFVYDEGVRSPLIVHVPEKWRAVVPAGVGPRVDTPVSLLDLPPTVLALAGVEVPAHMHGRPLLGQRSDSARSKYVFSGRNRMDERTDFSRAATDGRFRYIRNYMPHRPWGVHYQSPWNSVSYQSWEREHLAGRLNAVQDRFWREKPFEELYDLQADADQVRNLASHPQHQARLADLRSALDTYMVAVNDNGFIPEGAPAEGWEASRTPGAYPLRRVMEVAAMAARRDAARLADLRAAAQAGNDVVRHWAAQGLLMLGNQARPALADLERLLNDPLPHTRVVACEALVKLDPQHRALDLLVGMLESHPIPRVRLHATEALDAAGQLVQPALERIRLATIANTDEYVVRLGVYVVLKLRGTYKPEMDLGGGGPGSAAIAKRLIS